MAANGNSVFVGTTSGLGIKRGDKEIFIRGMDAVEKLKAKGIMKSSQGKLRPLPEDYVTSLYPVKEGVWIASAIKFPSCLIRQICNMKVL